MSCASCNVVFYLEQTLLELLTRCAKCGTVDQTTGRQLRARIDGWKDKIDECCGIGAGLLGYVGHLMRDHQQQQPFKKCLRAMIDGRTHTHVAVMSDYNTKVDRKKEVQPKSDAYGGSKISSHGDAIALVMPEPNLPGVVYNHYPPNAMPGALVWISVIIGKSAHMIIERESKLACQMGN